MFFNVELVKKWYTFVTVAILKKISNIEKIYTFLIYSTNNYTFVYSNLHRCFSKLPEKFNKSK